MGQVNLRAARHFKAVVPSDAAVLASGVSGLWVGGAGNVTVKDHGGATSTFTAVPAGTHLPIAPSMVLSTGTTATLLVALYD